MVKYLKNSLNFWHEIGLLELRLAGVSLYKALNKENMLGHDQLVLSP